MENTQNFITNIVAYEVIFRAIRDSKRPMRIIRQYNSVINLLNRKPNVELITDLKKLNLEESTINVLEEVTAPNHAILPLLIAYHYCLTDHGFSVDFIEKTLSRYQFSDNDLWIFYDAIIYANINKPPFSFMAIHKRINETKEIILSHISDSPRKHYEKAKLLIYKGG